VGWIACCAAVLIGCEEWKVGGVEDGGRGAGWRGGGGGIQSLWRRGRGWLGRGSGRRLGEVLVLILSGELMGDLGGPWRNGDRHTGLGGRGIGKCGRSGGIC